jgi:hypothetical protein
MFRDFALQMKLRPTWKELRDEAEGEERRGGVKAVILEIADEAGTRRAGPENPKPPATL